MGGPGRVRARRGARAPSAAARAELEDFLVALRAESGLAPNTLLAYRRDLVRFLGMAAPRGAPDLARGGTPLVVAHLAALRKAGYAEASVARALSAVRQLARHLAREGALEREPTARLSSPARASRLPRTLAKRSIAALLAAPRDPQWSPGAPWRAARDRALLELLYASGARVSEAVGLRLDALEPGLGVARLDGKGGKSRLVPLAAPAREALAQWIDGPRRALAGAARAPHVFLGARGARLGRGEAGRIVRRAARVAGLAADLSPHALRHAYATHLVEGGADLRSVQELLGHASIKTTEVYTHLDADRLFAVHKKHHPRA